MDDWLLKYEKEMRDWRNLEYQKKLDARLERVRRFLDRGYAGYAEEHRTWRNCVGAHRATLERVRRALEKEAAGREPRRRLNVLCWRRRLLLLEAGACFAVAVKFLFSDLPSLAAALGAALSIGACFWLSFNVYKGWNALKSTISVDVDQ